MWGGLARSVKGDGVGVGVGVMNGRSPTLSHLGIEKLKAHRPTPPSLPPQKKTRYPISSNTPIPPYLGVE